jgi:hypothetical protein
VSQGQSPKYGKVNEDLRRLCSRTKRMSEWANVQTVSDVYCQITSNEQTLSAVTVSRANKKTWRAFAKLPIATNSSDLYIYTVSIRMGQLGSQSTDFH